ncbi:tetratricopeptide repeat protein [Candidatus Altiarchaeota archaeon]
MGPPIEKRVMDRRVALKVIGAGIAASALPGCKDPPESAGGGRSREFELPEAVSYARILDWSLSDVVEGVKAGKLPLVDGLLKISQDAKGAGITGISSVQTDGSLRGASRDFSVDQADSVKKLVYGMAGSIATNMAARRRSIGGDLTGQEKLEEVNKVVFEPGEGFQFRRKEDFALNLLFTGGTSTFTDIWEKQDGARRGICEDLVGVYMSVVDVLRWGGMELPVQPRVVPGHTFVEYYDGRKQWAVELTRKPGLEKILAPEDHDDMLRKKNKGYDRLPVVYFTPKPHAALSNELLNCSLSFKKSGNADKMVEYLELARELTPDIPAIHANLGEAYQATGRLDEARKSASKALEIDPGDRNNYVTMALVLQSLSEAGKTNAERIKYRDLMIDQFGLARKRGRDMGEYFGDANMFQDEGRAFQERYGLSGDVKDLGKALDRYDRFEKLSGDHLNASNHKADAHLMMYRATGDRGSIEAAYSEYDRGMGYLKKEGFSMSYQLAGRGYAHYLLGRYGEAITDLDRSIKMDESSHPPRSSMDRILAKGMAHIKRDQGRDFDDGSQAFAKAIKELGLKGKRNLREVISDTSLDIGSREKELLAEIHADGYLRAPFEAQLQNQ